MEAFIGGNKTVSNPLSVKPAPKCGMKLIEIDYKGIKVDKCSECEGVWLDDRELEAISKFEKTSLDKLFGVFMK